MNIALFYAMPSEIDSLIHGERPMETIHGVSFYRIRDNMIACCGGVGKVNAAMAAEKFIQHDVDTTGCGDPIGMVSTVNMVEFPTSELDRAKAAMARTGYAFRTGTVATGDWFGIPGARADWIRNTFHPLLCEMEGGAAAQVCCRCGVPFMALKSVSDCL